MTCEVIAPVLWHAHNKGRSLNLTLIGPATGSRQRGAVWSSRRDEPMVSICEPPMNLLLATLFLLIAVGAAWRGGQLLVKGLRQADHPSGSLWVVRGIRGWIVALSMGALSGGVLWANKGLLAFGAIFLGE